MEGTHLASTKTDASKEGGNGVANPLRGEIMLGDLIWVRPSSSSWWPAQVVDANTVSESVKPIYRSVGEVLVRMYGSYKYLYVDPMKCRSDFEHILEQNNGSYTEIFQKALQQASARSKSGRSKGQGPKPKENGGIKQQSSKKNNLANNGNSFEARVSSRRKRAMNTPQKHVVNGNMHSESNGKNSKQEKVQKKLNQSSPSAKEQAKLETPKKDGAQNKLKRNNPRDELEAKLDTPEQNGSQKKLKPNTPSTANKPKLKSKESARRTKILQSIGLIAPPGSPFSKDALN